MKELGDKTKKVLCGGGRWSRNNIHSSVVPSTVRKLLGEGVKYQIPKSFFYSNYYDYSRSCRRTHEGRRQTDSSPNFYQKLGIDGELRKPTRRLGKWSTVSRRRRCVCRWGSVQVWCSNQDSNGYCSDSHYTKSWLVEWSWSDRKPGRFAIHVTAAILVDLQQKIAH